MNTKIIGKNVIVTPAIKEKINAIFDKLQKFEFVNESANCTATVRVVKKDQIVEITVNDKKTIRVEKRSECLYDAIDMAEETLIRKLKKEKEKFIDSKRVSESHEYVETEDLDRPAIVKEKWISLSTITKEKAIEDMEALEHDFHLFRDEETGFISALYRRKDDDYGVIMIKHTLD